MVNSSVTNSRLQLKNICCEYVEIDKANRTTRRTMRVREGGDLIPIIIFRFLKIYISFLSFTRYKKPCPTFVTLFLESPPKKSLFLLKYKWRTDSIIAPLNLTLIPTLTGGKRVNILPIHLYQDISSYNIMHDYDGNHDLLEPGKAV